MMDLGLEFDRQVANLLERGYPALAGLTDAEFGALLAPLRARVTDHPGDPLPPSPQRVPFVLVTSTRLVPAEQAMALTRLSTSTKPGFADLTPAELTRFTPIDELEVPDTPAYLAFDLERGEEFRNLTPEKALPVILERGRTPLTVAEGIALVTHYPATLVKNHCFSLVGSRCGDRRVPAIWISQGAPKLGWCWAGNPHTWLGSASAAGRAGARVSPRVGH